jgi:glycosyltransferase involved in cell wall biosynthesis
VTRVKGLEYAIRAVAGLDPELKVVLNIIGTGPLVGELKALAEELGVGDRVRFLGFKDNVYDYLAHIDVLIMPSMHEGLPYTILEAMSLGVPIIASRAGGLVEAIDDNENGLLVPVGDIVALSKMISILERNRDTGEKLSILGRASQIKKYSLGTMGAGYRNSYEQSHSLFFKVKS